MGHFAGNTQSRAGVKRAIEALRDNGRPIDDSLLAHLSPVGWEHINLTGDYVWHANKRVAGAFDRCEGPRTRSHACLRPILKLSVLHFPFRVGTPISPFELKPSIELIGETAIRCLIPADGFYEWRTIGGMKIPFSIGMKDDSPFVFAGLWEGWKPDEDVADRFKGE